MHSLIAPLRALLMSLMTGKSRVNMMMTLTGQGVDLALDGVAAQGLAAADAIADFGAAHRIARITIDDVMDTVQEETSEDMYHIAGLGHDDTIFNKTIDSVKKRLPWLYLNLLTALTSVLVIGFFEDTADAALDERSRAASRTSHAYRCGIGRHDECDEQ